MLTCIKTYTLVIFVGLMLYGCSSNQAYKQSILPISKEVTCIENIGGRDFHYLAWGIGSDNISAETDALKAAVYAAMTNSTGACVQLMQSSEIEKNQDYILKFFSEESTWKKYVTSTSRGRIDPDKRLKLEDGGVKLGVDVIVNAKNLREDLERSGAAGDMRIK